MGRTNYLEIYAGIMAPRLDCEPGEFWRVTQSSGILGADLLRTAALSQQQWILWVSAQTHKNLTYRVWVHFVPQKHHVLPTEREKSSPSLAIGFFFPCGMLFILIGLTTLGHYTQSLVLHHSLCTKKIRVSKWWLKAKVLFHSTPSVSLLSCTCLQLWATKWLKL